MPSSSPPERPELTRFVQLIEKLANAEVDFIVVGGVAAILAGAGITTSDLDILFQVEDENIRRLLRVLEDIDAVYVDLAQRRIRPTPKKLREFRMNLFDTNLGRFDVLPKLSDRWTYEDFLPHSVNYELGGVEFRSLSLDALIQIKEQAGRPKDRAVLPHLRRIAEFTSEPEKLEETLEFLKRKPSDRD